MRLSSGAHLGYCTNVHPGETLQDVRRHVAEFASGVRERVAPAGPFGVGLRLSAEAARELRERSASDELGALLEKHGLYVFTINGFPYGSFHQTRVKERVYEPDWLERERVHYADDLARALSLLLPAGERGSVSTVPGCFRSKGTIEVLGDALAANLLSHVETLFRLRAEGGPLISLALEPEPGCVLETTEEAVTFLERFVLSRAGVERFAKSAGVEHADAELALREHLGLCLDACHAAVEFEDPAQLLALVHGAGIGIKKLQISAGLRVFPRDAAARSALAAFDEPVYLHQTVVRTPEGALRRYNDLPEALADAGQKAGTFEHEEWRVHFHVPIFREKLGRFESTQGFLRELLRRFKAEPFTDHLEVETYTWDVLPPEFRDTPVVEAIARELSWVAGELGQTEAPAR